MSLRVLILHITKHREGENREGEYRGEHSEGEHSEGEYSEGEHSEGESLRAQPIANKMNEDEVARKGQTGERGVWYSSKVEWLLAVRYYRRASV